MLFGRRLTDSMASDHLCKTEFIKGILADSCVVFARGIWDSFSPSSSRRGRGDAGDADGDHLDGLDRSRDNDLDAGGKDSLFAAYRYNEAFSEALQASNANISEYALVLDDGENIDAHQRCATSSRTLLLSATMLPLATWTSPPTRASGGMPHVICVTPHFGNTKDRGAIEKLQLQRTGDLSRDAACLRPSRQPPKTQHATYPAERLARSAGSTAGLITVSGWSPLNVEIEREAKVSRPFARIEAIRSEK
jgi:hypothetical protein